MTSSERWAVVTGAAQGIGLATAHALHEAGYYVSCWDLDDAKLGSALDTISPNHERLHKAVCDITDREQIEAAVADIGTPKLHVLVNNAASWRPHGPLVDLDPARWNADLNLLLTSYQSVTSVASRRLATDGSIVSISSVHGLLASPNWGTYDIAKAALIQWTRVLAAELGHRGIRVNAVAPGIIASAADLREHQRNPKMRILHEDLSPLRRVGRPEDVAAAVVFLAGKSSGFITGQTLVVDGGMTTRMQLTAAEIATHTPAVATTEWRNGHALE